MKKQVREKDKIINDQKQLFAIVKDLRADLHTVRQERESQAAVIVALRKELKQL